MSIAWNPIQRPLHHPLKSLALCFVLWKSCLFLIASLCLGPGYDTSTLLLLRQRQPPHQSLSLHELLLSKLVRWDAIYFTAIAHRGYLYEQDWAFGWGFTQLVALVSRSIFGPTPTFLHTIWTSILISNASHFLSVIVLHRLVAHITSESPASTTTTTTNAAISFTAAVLHTLSPAGIFLSAPYSESLFSLLNFTGFHLFAKTLHPSPNPSSHTTNPSLTTDLHILASGIFFGLATTVRGNGLLSGAVFAHALARVVLNGDRKSPFRTFEGRRRILAICLAGVFVGVGFVGPQLIAYRRFCGDGRSRPWCGRLVPSVYGFVQDRYWNVGFLRYWTPSNIPLFLLAAPMLAILIVSAVNPPTYPPLATTTTSTTQPTKPTNPTSTFTQTHTLFSLPQLLLALLALSTFHVQIITRIASGYPIWYLDLAIGIVKTNTGEERSSTTTKLAGWKLDPSRVAVTWMVVYAVVQAGLFAAFLPPA